MTRLGGASVSDPRDGNSPLETLCQLTAWSWNLKLTTTGMALFPASTIQNLSQKLITPMFRISDSVYSIGSDW